MERAADAAPVDEAARFRRTERLPSDAAPAAPPRNDAPGPVVETAVRLRPRRIADASAEPVRESRDASESSSSSESAGSSAPRIRKVRTIVPAAAVSFEPVVPKRDAEPAPAARPAAPPVKRALRKPAADETPARARKASADDGAAPGATRKTREKPSAKTDPAPRKRPRKKTDDT